MAKHSLSRLGQIGKVTKVTKAQAFLVPLIPDRSTPGTPTSLERPVRCAGYAPYLTLFLDPSSSGHGLGRDITINGRGVHSSLAHAVGSLP